MAGTFDNVTAMVRRLLDRAAPCRSSWAGDHGITYPVVRAYAEPLHVVHFDAHLDYLPFVHGLELTNSHPFRHIARMAHVRSLTQIGIRSLRNSQVMMDDSLGDGNRIVTMEEFRDVTPRGLVDRIPRDAACYVSVDVDVLDLPLVPGCVSAEPNGFLYAELRDTLRALAEHTRIVGFDLVEVNPMLDIGTGITSYLAAHTIVEFLGWLCAQPWWIAGRDAREAAPGRGQTLTSRHLAVPDGRASPANRMEAKSDPVVLDSGPSVRPEPSFSDRDRQRGGSVMPKKRNGVSRREFIRDAALLSGGLAAVGLPGTARGQAASGPPRRSSAPSSSGSSRARS